MSTTFDTVGEHSYSVPSDASSLIIECWGAEGAAGADDSQGAGGLGGYAKKTVDTDTLSTSTLAVFVGGNPTDSNGGFNGGADGGTGVSTQNEGGGGGGASDVRESSGDLSTRLAVGGGGGGGANALDEADPTGGDAGGDQGSDGDSTQDANGGGGATQSAGGSGGTGDSADGSDGSLGSGGAGASNSSGSLGGGGGGGYYGGGGGGAGGRNGSGGGGGSSLGDTTTAGEQSGDGKVVITAVTPPDPPQNVSVDATRETEADLSWDASQDADEYRLYRHDAADPFNNGSQVATISDDGSATYSHTDTGLDEGKQYHYQVTAFDENAGGTTDDLESDPSSEVTGTTELPATEIDNTDPQDSEISLEFSVTDGNSNGSLDVYRSTDGSLGSQVTSISDLSATSYTDTGLTNGTQYRYTLRRDTGDATADSAQASETAGFRPLGTLSATVTGETSVDLSWGGDSSWSGTTEIWRDRADYDYAASLGTQVDSVDASTESYTDSPIDPNTEFSYHVRAVPDAEDPVTSNEATGTTDGPNVPKTRSRSAEWTAEIRTDGRVLRPPVVDEPTLQPTINDLSEITIPTTEGPWTRVDLDGDAPELRIWYEGVRQPIEALERVEDRDSGAALVARGGVELLDRVQVEVDQQPVHELVRDLAEEHTTYTYDVDDPPEDVSEETLFDVSTASDWADLFGETDLTTIPIGIDDEEDELYLQQVCWTREGEDYDDGSLGSDQASTAYSGSTPDDGSGWAARFASSGDFAEWEFDVPHEIPASEVALEVREDATSEDHGEITWSIDGNTAYVMQEGLISGANVAWFDRAEDYSGGALSPEDNPHTLRAEQTSSASGEYLVDVVAPFDGRYEDGLTFDNSVSEADNGDNYLDGPETRPDEVEIETDLEELVLSAVSAELTTVWDDTSAAQQLAVSNDGGSAWLTAANAQTLSQDFASPGALLQARLRLSRHGSQEATPANGFEGQRVDSLQLDVELDDTPLAVNQTWDASLREVLQDLADQSGQVWDVQWGGDGLELNWTTPGQRTADVDAAVTTYDVAEDRRDVASRVVVRGGAATRTGERVDADHGTAVDLEHGNLVDGRESVYDPADGTAYARGTDYEIDYAAGTITTLAGGNVSDGATIAVTYDYETRGAFEASQASVDRTVTRSIPGLTSERQCSIAARRIVLEISEPALEATVGIQPGPRDWSVVDRLDVAELDDLDSVDVKDTTSQAGELRLRLGSRQNVEEIVSEIRGSVGRLSRRV